ncbi:MAG TPA: BTAD domain-containing putative transcriptional regulator [Pyrinomonadaceae bacterium]|jgi:DNA-binding SARP family transcriptional activator|nr:BTAD domain-containing putative transcriptional regulator [Pyrinomonadaceae bacterium]
MSIRFQLFGKFSVHRDDEPVRGLEAGKEQELLSYLLVGRDRCHPREALATLLWGDTSTDKSKKYLRQALWHVQTALEDGEFKGPPVLLVGHDWVQVKLQSGLWLDVALFEQAFAATCGVPGKDLGEAESEMLKEALELYKGDLLEGCYHDWCLFERERLQNIYLSMLEKLLIYSEKHGKYEAGQDYGLRILRYDPARESTHRQLMHLQYRAGDRTGALRQYKRCVRALDEDLGVSPQRRTTALYEAIRADRLDDAPSIVDAPDAVPPSSLPEVLGRLKRLQSVLAAIHKQVQSDIKAVEQGLEATKQYRH